MANVKPQNRYMRQEYERLKKEVQPDSPLHKNTVDRVDNLKKIVISVADLAKYVGVNSEDIKIAFEAVVCGSDTQKYSGRRSLNTDDIDGYDD